MVLVLQETRHSGGFVVSEANLYRSRDQGMFVNSGTTDLIAQAGLVLALASEGVDATVVAKPGNTGNGTLGGLSFGAAAAPGGYLVKFTSATAFTVTAPNGVALPGGTAGVAYTDAALNFTITAGGTAFVAGDTITVNVPAADMTFVPWTNAAPATAIMFNTDIIPALSTGRVTVLSRSAEVNGAELTWDPSISGSGSFVSLQATAAQQLRALGIIVR